MYKNALKLVFFFSIIVIKGFGQNLFFEKVTGQDISPVTSIHGIAKDSVGYLWFGSWNGAYRYDGKSFTLYHHQAKDPNSLPNNRIRNIISDPDTGLWFLTFDRKYVKYQYQLNNFVTLEDDKVPQHVKNLLANNDNQLNRDKVVHGNVYYLKANQLTSKHIKTGKVNQYLADISQPGRLADDHVSSFYIDDENIIWLGTRNGDVYKVNPNRNPFNLHYSYRPNTDKSKLITVRTLLTNKDNTWLGTDDGVLIYNKEGAIDLSHPFYQSNSQIKFVRTLFKDQEGNIWIGGVSGLECYQTKANKIIPIFNQDMYPNREKPFSVFAIKNNDTPYLWIGLYDGLARVDIKSKTSVLYDFENKIQNHSVTDILFTDQKHILLATEGNGIVPVKLDAEKNAVVDEVLLKKGMDTSITAKIIYSLFQDTDKNLWVGSSEGLYKINMNTYPLKGNSIPLQYNSSDAYISSVTDDVEGNIWVSHKGGISVIDANNNKVLNYQKQDQYNSWSFWERAFYKEPFTNIIYYGAKNGYVSFDPQQIKKVTTKQKKIILKKLYVSNKEVIPAAKSQEHAILSKTLSQTKSVKLAYDNRSFSIDFTSLNFQNTSKEVFEYQLSGYDEGWVKTSNHKVSYQKVPAGTYTFKIKTVSNVKKVPVTTLNIQVLSPWYQTIWAKIFFVCLVLLFVFWVFREILYRDRLRNEIKLERLNREQQEELNKEKLAFFTSVSHELKTPLTLISGPLKKLQEGDVNKEDKQVYLSIVNRNVANLSKLIHQILDFRKSEKGKLKINSTLCNLNGLIDDCYDSFKLIAANRKIQFDLNVPDHPLFCYIDKERVEQILMNILSNAFKYTPDGGTVSFVVQLNKKQTALKINIKDSGVGIDALSLHKIFKPFNNVGARPFHGNSSGIGLSLTKNIVELLQGTIELESELKKGTHVLIKLPFVKGTPQSQEEVLEAPLLETKKVNKQIKKLNKPTLLIVEDNIDVQTYLKKELSKKFVLLQEYDGKKGLETAIKYVPDLIVSDIMMPIMEGVDMCKHLKLNQNTSHIPVILLTAKDSDENQIEGYQYGAEAYITKPFSVDVLKAQIKSVLDNRAILQKQLASIKSVEDLQKDLPNLDNIFLKSVTEKINKEIKNSDLNSEKLARLMDISQSQLYRKLKAITGSTVHEFITRVKMDCAKELLTNSNLNISQVAYETGFTEPSNFSRTFSKYYGVSPSKYLKTHK